MTELEKAQHALASLSPTEKVRVLEWIVRDLGDSLHGIESDPAVAGGDPCIARTRIPVWTLVRARQLGASEAELLQRFPTLRAEDLVNDDAHRDEIENQIRDNEAA